MQDRPITDLYDIYREPYIDLLHGMASIHPDTHFGQNVRIGRHVVIEQGCWIGDNTLIGHGVVMRPGTRIGSDCMIGHGTVFEGEAFVGDRVTIHCQCHMTKHIIVEDNVFIGPQLTSTNTKNIVHGRGIELILKGFTARRAARIGGGVNLAPGIEIGENAFIGFGSVVTKDVPPRQMWYGCPAVYRGDVPEEEVL